MRSPLVMRFAVTAAFIIASAGGSGAKTIPQSTAELTLGSKKLVGIWDCTGTGNGKAVTAKMRWFHLEDGSLSFSLHPAPAGKAHPTLMEAWEWEDYSDTAGYQDWRTRPDPSSFDQASFTSAGNGFKGGKMLWIRHAQASTMARTFTWLGPDHLGFVEQYGVPPIYVYKLDCKRTLKQEPPPQ